jgi:hypothetical protein
MHFRRELDFDDLIETIDQLTDEQIDETVNWQMTESPAAKTEGIRDVAAAERRQDWRPPRAQPTRYEIPVPGRQTVVVSQMPDFLTNPLTDDSRWISPTYNQIEINTRTMIDPMYDAMRVGVSWGPPGGPIRGTDFMLSREMLEAGPVGVELFREPNVVANRDLVLVLGRGRIHAFLESR